MKLEGTSTQPVLKLLTSESNALVMIVWTCDFKLGHCWHLLSTSLREKKSGFRSAVSSPASVQLRTRKDVRFPFRRLGWVRNLERTSTLNRFDKHRT
jgi:hypothetical protein